MNYYLIVINFIVLINNYFIQGYVQNYSNFNRSNLASKLNNTEKVENWLNERTERDISELNFGIIIDAGSTGTRLFVYEFFNSTSCEHSPFIVPSVTKEGPRKGKQFKIKKNVGIADLEPHEIPGFLEFFLKSAREFIPKEKHAQTPLFLKATAGMRLIDYDLANSLIDTIKEVFKKSGFLFDDRFGAQIIPGEYEGVFGWMTVNYLAYVLGDPTGDIPSVGYFDLGGASSQITFEPKSVPLEESFPINLNGTSRVVYTHSYLRYGRNQARFRHYDDLYHISEQKKDKLESPCLVRDYHDHKEIDGKHVTIVGTGDFEKCLKETKKLLNLESECFTYNCGVNSVFMPPIESDMELYGTSSMFDTAKFFKCHGLSDLRCLKEKATKKCGVNMKKYLRKHNKWVDDKDFWNFCFNAAFMVNLIGEGYGLDLDRPINFEEEVNGIDIGWTLGAMIYEVNLLFPSGQCCP